MLAARQAIKAAAAAASTDSSRPALNAVYLEPSENGATVTATDGHLLVTLPVAYTGCTPEDAPAGLDAAPLSAPVSVPTEAVKAALAVKPPKGYRHGPPILADAPLAIGSDRIQAGDMLAPVSIPYAPMGPEWGQRFPDYRQVIPPGDGPRVAFAVEVLERLLAVAKAAGADGIGLAFSATELRHRAACFALLSQGQETLGSGVVMPWRAEAYTCEAPAQNWRPFPKPEEE